MNVYHFQVFGKIKQPMSVYELDKRDDGRQIQDNLANLTGFRTVSIIEMISSLCLYSIIAYLVTGNQFQARELYHVF